MVIEFKSSKDKLIESKRKRFKELNTRYFIQNITDDEVIEWNKLEDWLRIHS
jgi:hypothetical protein